MIFVVFLKTVIVVIFLLLAVAFFTLVERKVLAAIQRRRGPNVVGVYGLLQPLADGFKLFLKEFIVPAYSNKFIFIIAPIISFSISLSSWAVIPFSEHNVVSSINLNTFFLFMTSSLSVYGIILSGWSSNSKYAFLGSLRSAAQMLSYEVCLGVILASFAGIVGTLNLQAIVEAQTSTWFCFSLFPLFLVFFICSAAETNRHPFDLPEAESELVSGYNVEYSGMSFALFSLAEYINIFSMSAINTILFFGGWLPIKGLFLSPFSAFSLKLCFFVILFIFIRAMMPRYRYDQLMELCWKNLLPISFFYFFFMIIMCTVFQIQPF